ncbi:transmembrane signal receptor [Lithospermum erythrorhizon]|uniref:Transmembrane signal receptor n=1 Tax=Lithospermum erythrorhizon TaxID=34254 RepID=A0AAV3Q2Q8_LITER
MFYFYILHKYKFNILLKNIVRNLCLPQISPTTPNHQKMGIWTSLTETITLYTGLSPTAFFTIIALMVVTYKVVSGMFVSSDDYSQVKQTNEFVYREPVQLGEVTAQELVAYDGSDPNKPLLMAIKGQIYDVSRSRFKLLKDKCSADVSELYVCQMSY